MAKTYEVEVEFTAVRKFYIDANTAGEAEAVAEEIVENNDYDTEGEGLEAQTTSVIAHLSGSEGDD